MTEAYPLERGAATRPEWMGGRGREIYSTWTQELLSACDTPAFWDEYEQTLVDSYAGMKQGVVIGPDDLVSYLVHDGKGRICALDEKIGLSRNILLPHLDEIMHYTSAADFLVTKSESPIPRTPEQAVIAHARDSLNFAVKLGAGLVNDVYLQHTGTASDYLQSHDIYGISKQPPAEHREIAKTIYAGLVGRAGEWWDKSLEAPRVDESVDAIEQTFSLHKLAFATRALRNATLADALEAISVTGFDALGQQAAHCVEFSWGNGISQKLRRGWVERADRFQLPRSERKGLPLAVLLYDLSTDTFDIRPETRTYLLDALRSQNQNGLTEQAVKTGGNIPELKPSRPITRGCPVTGLGIMSMTAAFTAKAYDVVVERQQRLWGGLGTSRPGLKQIEKM